MKLRGILLVLLFTLSLYRQTTPNLHPNLPRYETANWKTLVNANFSLLASYLFGASPSLNVAGHLAIGGTATPPDLHGVQFADRFSGATADIQLNACIAAVIALGGGTCDARGLIGNQTIAAEVAVGNSKGTPVELLLAHSVSYFVSIANKTSSGFRVYDQGSIRCQGGNNGSPRASIYPASRTTNVDSLLRTDPTGISGGSYVDVEGISIYNPSGIGTYANGLLHVTNLFDGSQVNHVLVNSFGPGPAVVIEGVCCTASFQSFTANSNYASGGYPVLFRSASNATVGFSCFACSFTHPGAGQSILVFNAATPSQLSQINFYNTYFEANTTDTTTPLVQITSGSGPINFYGTTIGLGPSATDRAYVFNIASGSGLQGFSAYDTYSWTPHITNIVNDGIHHTTASIPSGGYGSLPFYGFGATSPIYASGLATSSLKQPSAARFAGTSACSHGTKTITLPITYGSQPSILVFDETTPGGTKLSAKSTSGFTVSCSGATDAFDWMVVGNPD